MIHCGCKGFLEVVLLVIQKSEVRVEDVSIVRKFLDVFLEDLSDLPLEREIKFAIDVYLRTELILIPLYQMALTKLMMLEK